MKRSLYRWSERSDEVSNASSYGSGESQVVKVTYPPRSGSSLRYEGFFVGA